MKRTILGAAAVLVSATLAGTVLADQNGTPTTTSVKPHLGAGPAEQKSVPSAAPSATTTRKTGATNQSSTVKTMNSNENAKVETEGK